jgi:hypothetical protein
LARKPFCDFFHKVGGKQLRTPLDKLKTVNKVARRWAGSVVWPIPGSSHQPRRDMKLFKTLLATCCAFALLTGGAFAQEDKEKKECCPATAEGQKACAHECCKKAGEAGKVCKKCHKEEKKEEAK